MKISKKDLSLILYLLGAVFAIGAIFYGNSIASKTETLKTENDSLSKEVAYLQDLYDHQQEYQQESERMNLEMEEIKEQFPAEVRPETQIMYTNGLEAKLDVLLDEIGMPGTELVTVAGDFSVPTSGVTADPAATGDGTTTDGTVTETAAVSAAATTISLYRTPADLTYQASYKGLKDLIRTVNEDTDRKSIEQMSVAFDNETGNLRGSLKISMYSLSGTDKEYQAPVVTGVTDGTQQLFVGATTLNRTGANLAGDAATADGKAESAETVESNEE